MELIKITKDKLKKLNKEYSKLLKEYKRLIRLKTLKIIGDKIIIKDLEKKINELYDELDEIHYEIGVLSNFLHYLENYKTIIKGIKIDKD